MEKIDDLKLQMYVDNELSNEENGTFIFDLPQ